MSADTLQSAHPAIESIRVSDCGVDLSLLLFMLFMELEGEIARADRKAEIVLGVDVLVVATLAFIGRAASGPPAATVGHFALLGLRTITLVVVLVSVYFALGVAAPRFRSGRHTEGSTHQPTLFYVGYITTLEPGDYVEEFMALTLNDVTRMVMMGIHAKANIVQTKFSGVRYSMLATGLALALWVLGEMLTGILR